MIIGYNPPTPQRVERVETILNYSHDCDTDYNYSLYWFTPLLTYMDTAHIHVYMDTAYIHTYMHAYIHTYMHACMHTYIHTCTHTYTHTYIHTYIDTYIHTHIHTYIHAYIMHTSWIHIRKRRAPIELHGGRGEGRVGGWGGVSPRQCFLGHARNNKHTATTSVHGVLRSAHVYIYIYVYA